MKFSMLDNRSVPIAALEADVVVILAPDAVADRS
jgi:hypothetical protein